MKKFWQTTDAAGKVTAVLIGLGALLILLWMTCLDNSDNGNWVDYVPVIGGILFVGGWIYLATKSPSKHNP
jgi:uncharacterized membrane protein YgdD (TMEM256/DUF423 family)